METEQFFVKGKWYKRSCGKSLMCFNGDYDRDGDPCGYGLLRGDVWMDANDLGWGGDFIPATPQEVEDALIEEAKRRYEDGYHIKLIEGIIGKTSGDVLCLYGLEVRSDGRLMCSGRVVGSYTLFKDGVWAEVVEQEETPDTRSEAHDFCNTYMDSATVITTEEGTQYIHTDSWVERSVDGELKVLSYDELPYSIKTDAVGYLNLKELIEEARDKIRKVTISYPCWIDGERTVNKYCIGHRIEAYTEKEAIAQYVKEKVLEIL